MTERREVLKARKRTKGIVVNWWGEGYTLLLDVVVALDGNERVCIDEREEIYNIKKCHIEKQILTIDS